MSEGEAEEHEDAKGLSLKSVAAALGLGVGLSEAASEASPVVSRTWDCGQCGLVNPAYEISCDRCGFGWSGHREVLTSYGFHSC